MADRTTEKDDLLERLKLFVTYFVEDIETKLAIYFKILEGKSVKPGKFTENYADFAGKTVGEGVGGVLILLLGTAAVVPAKLTSSGLEKLTKIASAKLDRNGQKRVALSLHELIYSFNEDKKSGRRAFARIASEIFHSFEMQFRRATSKEGHRKAMRLLAKEAADRYLYCAGNSQKCIESITELRPKPKLNIHPEGKKILYEYQNQCLEWKTSSLFTKSGVCIYNSTEEEYEFYLTSYSKSEKYGYRRLFIGENINSAFHKVKLNSDLWKPVHIGDMDFYEDQIDDIVDKMKLDEEKILSAIRDLKREFTLEMEEIKIRNAEIDEISDLMKNLERSLSEKYEAGTSKRYDEIKNTIEKLDESTNKKLDKILSHQDVVKTSIIKSVRDYFPLGFSAMAGVINYLFPKNNQIIFRLANPVKSFSGRVNKLKELRTSFENNTESNIISQTTVICGLGGSGKSELARKYAQNSLESRYYINVVFINMQNDKIPVTLFRKLAEKINIAINQTIDNEDEQRDIQEILDDVYDYFDKSGRTLFIFDNAKDYNAIKSFLPKYSNIKRRIHILITSRNQCWKTGEKGDVKAVFLENFTPLEAAEFVKKTLGEFTDEADLFYVNKLLDRVQCLPLALKQATGYISQRNDQQRGRNSKKLTIQEYLVILDKNTEVLLSKGHYDAEEYGDQTVFTTWITTFKQIYEVETVGSLAIVILNIMSFLAPDDIDIDGIFTKIEDDQDRLWEAVNLLYNYSMINLSDGFASIHRLVQEVIRLNLKRIEADKDMLGQILILLEGTWYSEHLNVVWEHTEMYPEVRQNFWLVEVKGV